MSAGPVWSRGDRAWAWPWLAIGLIALAALISADLYRAYRLVGQREQDRLNRGAAVIDANLRYSLEATGAALGSVAREIRAMRKQGASPELISLRLDALYRSMAGARGLLFVDAEGQAVASSLRPLVGRSFRDTDRYQATRADADVQKLFISRPFTNPLGDHSVALSRVVLDGQGAYGGYVAAAMDPNYFQVLLNSLLYAPDMRAILVHGSGDVILRLPDGLRSRPEPLAPAQLPGLRERLADKRSTVFFERRQDAAGVERMGVLHVLYPGSIPVDFPLVAGLHRDRAAVYAEWRREVLIRGSLFGLVALLSVAGWGYQRSRQRAFKRLQADRESDQARAAAELSDSEARFRRLFEDMRQPVLLLQDGRCVAANRAAAALLQVDSPDELLGPFEGFRSPPMQPDGQPSGRKGLEMLDFARKTGSHAFEWQLLRRDGTPVTTQALVTVIRQGQNDLLHLVLNDVTEQKRMQERVEYLAFHDPVSGLPNRTAGLQRIGHELALARELRQGLAVLCLEITGPDLKRDSYGHGLEAPLFASVAARLAESLGVGSLIYHWESQRLLVLWPGLAGYEELARVGDRVLGSCNRPYGVEGLELHVQLGVGIAMYPQDGDDADTLTRHAEAALADAQGAGSGLARFYARQMDEAREDFLDTREALRLGLERGEFELYYQPQIALIDGSLHGAEALLRWRRPGLGLLAPGAFLEVAQASGLIVPLGMWVLRQACAQAVAWHAAGWKGLVVSVNLAEAQLRSEQTGHQLLELVLQSGLDPNRLELEFTEAALEAGGTAAEHMLSAWRARGIRLAIDRHGHGRSSLAQLQRIGVGRLKVVLGGAVSEAFPASDSPEGRLWHATAETARLMGMVSTAVGIESDDTVQALRAAGFTHGQGRFIAAPMSATDLQQMVIAVDARTALD